MIILDTDHIVTLKYSKSERFARLAKRMADSQDQDFVTTAITLEEQMRTSRHWPTIWMMVSLLVARRTGG